MVIWVSNGYLLAIYGFQCGPIKVEAVGVSSSCFFENARSFHSEKILRSSSLKLKMLFFFVFVFLFSFFTIFFVAWRLCFCDIIYHRRLLALVVNGVCDIFEFILQSYNLNKNKNNTIQRNICAKFHHQNDEKVACSFA